jgi:hypothetical protein
VEGRLTRQETATLGYLVSSIATLTFNFGVNMNPVFKKLLTVKKLAKSGFKVDYKTQSGSYYLSRNGERVRVSDHNRKCTDKVINITHSNVDNFLKGKM